MADTPYLQLLRLLFAIFWICLIACKAPTPLQGPPEPDTPVLAEVKAHALEFHQEVLEIGSGVYVAVGFGLANSIMIEGDDGVIIVDCMGTLESATKVKAAFRKITNKPVKALIFTHNHGDHIFGAEVMAGEDHPEVYAHALTNYYIDRVLNLIRPVVTLRSVRMFGMELPPEEVHHCGIGPRIKVEDGTRVGILRPTVTFEDSLSIEVAGVKLQMVHAPGETDDQLFVWMPEQGILLSGDNIYKSFPNLYTIRGTSYRDVKAWYQSLDRMRDLKPEILIPSHTRPLIGQDTIQRVLRDYRDAIQFVHDQTIRNMNLQLSPEEIVQRVKLPAHLAESPWLQPYYGNVEWSVRNIYQGYLGFFDGQASHLFTIPPQEKAQHMAELSGSKAALLLAAQQSLRDSQYTWALELSDYLRQLAYQPEAVSQLRVDALTALARQQVNVNARYYLMTLAQEEQGLVPKVDRPIQPSMAHSFPMRVIFENMAARLVPDKALAVEQTVHFYFPDLGETWTLEVRKGILEIQDQAVGNPSFTVKTDSKAWKELVAGIRGRAGALISGDFKIVGGSLGDFQAFMDLLKED